jgi:hypothetical protein
MKFDKKYDKGNWIKVKSPGGMMFIVPEEVGIGLIAKGHYRYMPDPDKEIKKRMRYEKFIYKK